MKLVYHALFGGIPTLPDSLTADELRKAFTLRPVVDALMRLALCHNTAQYLYLHCRDLVSDLTAAGHEVICVAPPDNYVARLRDCGFSIVPWTLSQHGTNFASEIASLVTLWRILRDINPDSLLSFTIKPNIYGALAGAAAGINHRFAVVTGLGYIFLNHDWRTRLLRRLIKLLCRHTFGSADAVFFYNDDDRNLFLEQHYLTSDRAVVIPGTGVDTVHFSPGSGTSRKAGPVFLFAGRLLADKGVREYAAAARAVRAAHNSSCFQLLGPKDNNPSAIEDEELRAWQDDGVISYLGATSDIRPFLDEADVFVLPSYREGLPRTILEALAMGKPVITTDVPGCRQTMIDGDNGFVVPPKNVEKLAEAMLRFVTDPDLIRRMGKRSRQMAEQYFNIGRVNQMVIDRIRSSVSGY